MAKALHITNNDDSHLVAINSLRVLVDGSDDEGWMAQGLEIDYFTCAKTEETVKRNFAEGLKKTVQLYLEEEGNIEDLLKVAPADVWHSYREAISNQKQKISLVTFQETAAHGFNQIAFLSSRTDTSSVNA